jgi:hypothetical protein
VKIIELVGDRKKVIRKKLNFFSKSGVRLLDYPRFVTCVTIDSFLARYCG